MDCTSVNARVHCAVTENRVHPGSGSCTPLRKRDCTLPVHSARSSKSQLRSIQQDQQPLIIRKTFLVLVLGFHVIGIDCRDKLRHNSFILIQQGVPLHRSVRIGWLTWNEISEDVHGVACVVPDFQTLQKQQLAVVSDPGTRFKISRQNF